MKSGITRRIDELGRIVVPKEIRYNLGIRDGEPLEIFVENNGIVIKKYSEIENISDISKEICDIVSDVFNVGILISDREKIITSNITLKEYINVDLIDKHKKLIDEREQYISEREEELYNINAFFTIKPIITSNDCSGLVIITTNNKNEESIKYAKLISKLIEKKLDIN